MSLPVILFATLGLAAGLVHFMAIAREADCLIGKECAWFPLGLRLGRLFVTLVVLIAASRHGWPALLAAAVGFMIGRQLVLARCGVLR